MSSNFPRIHSLSTIGIKQHYNCDYVLHPTRTDFSGESGSGKSMVADMIQLILVGSSVFKSSTESNKIREPKGMVLEPKGRQHGIGYAFLNIEVAHMGFIVLGAYIESSHNKVQPFMIQAGFDWDENLSPLKKPLYYEDLLVSNKVLSIEILQSKLSDVQLKPLTRRSFHQILFDQGLLSLNLTDKKTLESYASILRSFSRGKGFKTDSASLKSFLFGDDDQNRLMKKFQEEVQGINSELSEHQRYMEEISLIHDKQRHLVDVVRLSHDYESKRLEYHSAKVSFWSTQNEKHLKELDAVTLEFNTGRCKKILLQQKKAILEIDAILSSQKLDKELRSLNVDKGQSEQNEKIAFDEFEKAKQQQIVVNEVETWISDDNTGSLNDLEKLYKKERGRVLKKDLLNRFILHLKRSEQLVAFESSKWKTDFEVQRTKFPSDFKMMEDELATLKALAAFSNRENTNSLASWATKNLSFPVSLEHESVLVHFQKFPIAKPKVSEPRYVRHPEELFESLDIKKKTKNGFWINMDGVYEHIMYVDKRLLNTANSNELVELDNAHSDLVAQTKRLEQKIHNARLLKQTLDFFEKTEEAIHLYEDRENVLTRDNSRIGNLTEQEFDEHINTYRNKIEIKNQYDDAKKAFEKILANRSFSQQKSQELQDKIKSLLEPFDIITITDKKVDVLIEERNSTLKALTDELDALSKLVDIESISKATFPTDTGLTNVLMLISEFSEEYNHVRELKNTLDQKSSGSKKQFEASQQEFLSIYRMQFDFSQKLVVLDNPDEGEKNIKGQLLQTETKFKTKYDLVKEYADNQAQLSDYSVGMLAHNLLPTVFESSNITPEMVEMKIAERLSKLTRDMQEIGSRKVEILKRVFSEVHKTYNQYLEKIQGIDSYLKRKNHGITGGNRASLKYRKSTDYPERWMAPFRKQLDDALMNVGLFNDMTKEVDIYKMMLTAFKAAGGSAKVSPQDLLNPKSYFELDFDIKLETGESNAGSQGQTYTANALLGLARLSLIESDNTTGIKIMPIDEAEGLGGNYDMLHKLAKSEGYQIVSMSIETAGDIVKGEQYIYIMNENNLADESTYVPPLGIFSDIEPVEDINSFIKTLPSHE